ncbi:class 1b ribonucleoside-diphosphate reductase subunit beta ['Fragaria x ananassa' phyllody phytoplasma]|uniref:ribonucleoside-diphosphate reductase n=1 Tax='Fragaria x ananassa' phyllody phytoplasma TaxID=2358428 RepID=A0ABS5K2Q4_9MOLU|nr:class 1b ribonucleoside-diphosphate reductase subunit beta ['Fragaria x ananassa' phyllody phytoplasma]MBS2126152.1 class 1b ribonucleoside-diphosphate reductase subunit beta ['Fragaria x ananassa' phyllody phytoplasma]
MLKFLSKIYQGANWNQLEDQYTHFFYEQNLSQFWRPEDISLQGDLACWNHLTPEEKTVYNRNLLVLTFLDTYQGDLGIPVIALSLDEKEHQKKATLNFMGAMENAVHAKSYSNIFMSFLSNQEINQLFSWGKQQINLQNIMKQIIQVYETLEEHIYLKKIKDLQFNQLEFQKKQWQAMAMSVFLETWLFYSGFYYPLYFYGQGQLMQAGEIINLIIRDESIHGVYVGRLAIELYRFFDIPTQQALNKWLDKIMQILYQEQLLLVKTIYHQLNLENDVNKFVRYNANKALMNLGFDPYFPTEDVNPVIINGLNTETKTMDNFSMKGNGYQKMRSETLKDEDFYFDNC